MIKIAWVVFESLRQVLNFLNFVLKLHYNLACFHHNESPVSWRIWNSFLEKTAILWVVLDSLQKKDPFILFGIRPNCKTKTLEKRGYNNYRLMDYSSSESCICHPLQRWPAQHRRSIYRWEKRFLQQCIPHLISLWNTIIATSRLKIIFGVKNDIETFLVSLKFWQFF